MRRRAFIRSACATACFGFTASLRGDDKRPAPLEIGVGPQLFLDDYLIQRLDGLERQVQSPNRLDKPVLDNRTFGTTQPYLTVLPHTETNGYRIWYNHGP